MRVLIADDEPVALERLELAVRCIPGAEVVARAETGREALSLMRSVKPDIAVLDIQMPGLSGLDAAAALKPGDHIPEIIFVTAFEQHAVNAFDLQAVDYLLKPVAFDRFREALRRAKARLEARAADIRFEELLRLITALQESQANGGRKVRRDFWVRQRGEMKRIMAEDIIAIQAEGDYVSLETAASSHLVSESLKSIEARMDPNLFLRIHRGALVNLNAVRGLRRRGPRSLYVVLDNSRQLPVGPNYAKAVSARLTGGG
jgi:DNA-binding LytR/AlgR family response regulator